MIISEEVLLGAIGVCNRGFRSIDTIERLRLSPHCVKLCDTITPTTQFGLEGDCFVKVHVAQD